MSKDDVAALVERLEKQLGRAMQYEGSHVVVVHSSDLRDLLSAIKAQAAEIEAAEAKLSEARADGMREAARIAYGAPHYVSGMDPDEFGVMPPGSPYDKGRHDAMKAILAAIGETRDE